MLGAADDVECWVTSSDKEFVSLLRVGDILLFDSSYVTSALIKFADNSPVNHCAVFVGNNQFADVTHHDGDEPAVQLVDIDVRLAERDDYSVTALRHTSAHPTAGLPEVVDAVNVFTAGETSYAYLNLISLFVPAFLRAYRPNREPGRVLPRGLEWAAQAFLKGMDFESESLDLYANSPGSWTLTCSQFAYLCFARASPPLAVEVREPLGRYKPVDQTMRGVGDEPGNRLGMLGLEFHPGLLDDPGNGDLAGVVLRGKPGLNRQLGKAAMKAAKNICWHNWLLGAPEPAPEEGAVVPELVTPKDLWSSSSFTSRAILVRAPAEGPGRRRADKSFS